MSDERTLLESVLQQDPVQQFRIWFAEALESNTLQPEAMALSTVGLDGQPSNRMVLLKEVNERGFVFFSNYTSRKARELEQNPAAALTFWWPSLERQVRIEGSTTRLAPVESDEYFATRPRGSQIGAWASAQSAVLAQREDLEKQVAEIEARFAEIDVTRPEFWGGYTLVPNSIEFWQGRRSRLHDRIRYRRVSSEWVIERLSP